MKGKSFITLDGKKLTMSLNLGVLEDYCEQAGCGLDELEKSLNSVKNLRSFLFYAIDQDIEIDALRKLNLGELLNIRSLIDEAVSGNPEAGSQKVK